MSVNKTASRVCGVGINDRIYKTSYMGTDGKQVKCPFYTTWKSMLERCYSKKYQAKQPTYIGCTVIDEWLVFSTFRNWMESQDWENKYLDKDLLVQGNKQYGPTTCIFVSRQINNLLCLNTKTRGPYPLGVTHQIHNGRKRFQAQCMFYGKKKHLGFFDTEIEAADAYKKAKLAYIKEIALKEPNLELRAALLRLY